MYKLALLFALVYATVSHAGEFVGPFATTPESIERLFRAYVPDDLAPGSPAVILLHGGTQSMDLLFTPNAGGTKEWPLLADREGFLLLVPNGVNIDSGLGEGDEQQWNDCRADAPISSSGEDDTLFIDAVIDWAIATYAIDPTRVYATGSSNGGQMSYRLAIERPDRIAAIAVFISNFAANSECAPPSVPVPILICNGTADTFQPFGGQPVDNGRGTTLSAPATRDFWIANNRANTVPSVDDALPDVNDADDSFIERELYDAPAGGGPVHFYVIEGGGHQMPSIAHESLAFIDLLLGPQNRDVEAAQLAWDFVSQFAIAPSLAEGEDDACAARSVHSADRDASGDIELSDLLRVVQLFNVGSYGCQPGSEDGYFAGGSDQTCCPHHSDYAPQDWRIDLGELSRAIQFFNRCGYTPDPAGEDGFAPLACPID